MLRSAASVIVGYFMYALLMGAAVLLLQAVVPGAYGDTTGAPRTSWTVVVDMGLSVIFAIVAGYITASIARRAGVLHAALLAGVILLVGALNAAGRLTSATDLEPFGYQVAMIAAAALGVITGGALYSRQRRDAIA